MKKKDPSQKVSVNQVQERLLKEENLILSST